MEGVKKLQELLSLKKRKLVFILDNLRELFDRCSKIKDI